MRFRFCGDLDCPDWLLAEISLLTKISSVKMKLLTSNLIKSMLGKQPLDYAKVFKLTVDAKFSEDDVKASLATLTFIVTSAAKHNCDSSTLSNELQQLGLPKENATALCKAFGDNLSALQQVFRTQSLRLWKLEDVKWRVDMILGSSELEGPSTAAVQLNLSVRSPETGKVDASEFAVSADKFSLLLAELKQAEATMASFAQ